MSSNHHSTTQIDQKNINTNKPTNIYFNVLFYFDLTKTTTTTTTTKYQWIELCGHKSLA